MDEALWLPTENAVQVALRTQQIIAYESGVADTVDPMAGSYIVEYLTDEISKKVKVYLQKIDDMGGALSAIERGYQQNEIQDSAYRYQKAIETGDQLLVGVNAYQTTETIRLDKLSVDPLIGENQKRKLKQLRQMRDPAKVSELLTLIESASKSKENLVPLLITCVEKKITLGEICGVLRKTWGEYIPSVWA
jgi:methylmalonyl-CoA mutase N-terminal domain/subunit